MTKLDTLQNGAQVIYYSWQKDGVYVVTYTIPGPQVTEAVFEQMVTSMIAPASTPATPQSSASRATVNAAQPNSYTFAQAKQLVPFYLTEPQWIPSYLVEQPIMIAAAAPPGTLPTPQQIHAVAFGYRPTDQTQHYSVGLLEHGGTFNVQLPGTPTTLTIAEHDATRASESNGTASLAYFLWQDQGTTF